MAARSIPGTIKRVFLGMWAGREIPLHHSAQRRKNPMDTLHDNCQRVKQFRVFKATLCTNLQRPLVEIDAASVGVRLSLWCYSLGPRVVGVPASPNFGERGSISFNPNVAVAPLRHKGTIGKA